MRGVRLFSLLCLLAASPAFAQGPPARAPFTPIPCPSLTWTLEEPSVTPLSGARTFVGRYEGGAYVIEIPSRWNGELALWAHGVVETTNADGAVLRVQIPGDLRAHWLSRGFAWGTSSYRCNGNVPGIGLLDTMALRDVFRTVSGGRTPLRVYLAGASLGGRIVTLGLHEFPEAFAGGYAECAAGQETNDVRVAMAAAAEFLSGIHPDPQAYARDLTRMAQVFGRGTELTEKGRQLASVQIALTGGPRPFAFDGVLPRLLENVRQGFMSSPDAHVRAATNEGMPYGVAPGLGLSTEVLESGVPRKPADPSLRNPAGPFREVVPFDGRLLRPLITLHGTGDLQVPVSQQQALKRAVLRTGQQRMLVQRLVRAEGHCQFSSAERLRAFDDLVNWVRDGVRPEGDDVLGDLTNAGGRFTDPVRPSDPGQRDVPGSR